MRLLLLKRNITDGLDTNNKIASAYKINASRSIRQNIFLYNIFIHNIYNSIDMRSSVHCGTIIRLVIKIFFGLHLWAIIVYSAYACKK